MLHMEKLVPRKLNDLLKVTDAVHLNVSTYQFRGIQNRVHGPVSRYHLAHGTFLIPDTIFLKITLL